MSKQEQQADYVFEVLGRPGLALSPSARRELTQEFRALATTAGLLPLPEYQCLSTAPGALDDKLIVTMRDKQSGQLLAFTSTMYLEVPLDAGAAPSTVLHTGLTCIAPALHRQGLVAPLFFHIFAHLRPRFPRGMWITGLAGVPSTLGELAQYAADVYPSPWRGAPSDTHVRIARTVNERYRERMLIAPDAHFDEGKFVFYASNPEGSCFRKDTSERRWHHRDATVNEFYRSLLGTNDGNEVLCVGYLDWEVVFGMFKRSGKMTRKDFGSDAKL